MKRCATFLFLKMGQQRFIYHRKTKQGARKEGEKTSGIL
jgi:hypothetical protein